MLPCPAIPNSDYQLDSEAKFMQFTVATSVVVANGKVALLLYGFSIKYRGHFMCLAMLCVAELASVS